MLLAIVDLYKISSTIYIYNYSCQKFKAYFTLFRFSNNNEVGRYVELFNN